MLHPIAGRPREIVGKEGVGPTVELGEGAKDLRLLLYDLPGRVNKALRLLGGAQVVQRDAQLL
jgi:hypothetical protein